MGFVHRITENSRWMKRLVNVYPPFMGAGIRVRRISADFRELDVEMKLRWFNRNYVAAHFGGSLYSMTDPFFMLMMMKNLGPDYLVWDKFASIEFITPGKGTVTARFRLAPEDIDAARLYTKRGERYYPKFTVDVIDARETVVARVTKELYIRRKS